MTENLLPRATPRSAGLCAAGVRTLLDAVAEAGIELHSLMIVRGGAVLVEGWWAPFTSDRRHLLHSLSKSFTSLAVGLAVEDGLLDLDAPAFDLFPELVPDPRPAHLDRLTLRHALTMSTGHHDDPVSAVEAVTGADPLATFAALVPESEPGSVYTYNQLATFLAARSVERVTGRSLPDYLGERLWTPVGVTDTAWHRWDGHTMGFSGLHLSTEAVAAFGQLLLQRGRWNDRQLVPAEWIEAATRHQVDNDLAHRGPGAEAHEEWQQGYGFQFWRNRTGYRGDGAFGQFLVVWPDLDTVVVTTADTVDMHTLLDLLTEHLRPALTDGPGADAAADDAHLAARLAGLALPTPFDTGTDFAATEVPVTSGVGWADQVDIRPADDGWELRIRGQHGLDVTLPAGRGRWLEADWPTTEGRRPVPFVTAAGAIGDTFSADLRMIETPHSLQLRVDPGGCSLSWRHQPLHGDQPGDHGLPAEPPRPR